MPLTGEAKKAYQREYMRRRRAAAKKETSKKETSKKKTSPAKVRPVRPAPDPPAIITGKLRYKPTAWGPALADRIMKSMENRIVSEGRFAGDKFTLLEWQVKVVTGMMAERKVGISMGRGNGKTTFLANLACEVLDGELVLPRGQVNSTASSLDQGRTMFGHVLYFLGLDRIANERLNRKRRWRVIDNSHGCRIQDNVHGTLFVVLGSDSRRAHSRAPSMILADEPAQWVRSGRKLYNALKTSMGKQPNSRMVALGTMPEDETHWFYRMMKGHMGRGSFHLYAPDKDDDDLDEFSEETWREANPSYDFMEDLRKEIAEEAGDAKMGGEELDSFRALRLNLGTPEIEGHKPIVTLERWRAITRDIPAPKSGPVAVGVDLGGGTSMSSIAFYWPESGRLQVFGMLPDDPGLERKGKEDGVGKRYIEMERRGELFTYPGIAPDNPKFLKDGFEMIKGERIIGISADKYKQTDLLQAMRDSEIDREVEWRRVGRGPEGGYDVRAFQNEVHEGHLSCDKCLLLEHAISESVIHRDDNGNPALNKKRHKGRNDALQATILATGIGRRYRFPIEEEARPAEVSDYIVGA